VGELTRRSLGEGGWGTEDGGVGRAEIIITIVGRLIFLNDFNDYPLSSG